MPSISTLVDRFDTLDLVLWPESYYVDVSGGRGRVQTQVGLYGAFQTGSVYSVPDGASLSARVYPDALAGSTLECYTALWIVPATAGGTQYGIFLDRMTGNLHVENQVSYADAGRTSVAYSATTMAFWRIRRSGTNLIAETAPEASEGTPGTWTSRRSITVPSWMSTATNLYVAYEAFRDGGGTPGYSEIDYVNAGPLATSPGPGRQFLQFF